MGSTCKNKSSNIFIVFFLVLIIFSCFNNDNNPTKPDNNNNNIQIPIDSAIGTYNVVDYATYYPEGSKIPTKNISGQCTVDSIEVNWYVKFDIWSRDSGEWKLGRTESGSIGRGDPDLSISESGVLIIDETKYYLRALKK